MLQSMNIMFYCRSFPYILYDSTLDMVGLAGNAYLGMLKSGTVFCKSASDCKTTAE